MCEINRQVSQAVGESKKCFSEEKLTLVELAFK